MKETATSYQWRKDGYYENLHLRLRVIGALLTLAGVKDVLDVGCGMGRLRELLPADVFYFGCDGHVRDLPSLGTQFEHSILSESDTVLPFGERLFDAMVCSGFIEYFGNIPELFRKAQLRIRKGGHLVVSAINPWYPAFLLGRFGVLRRLPGTYWHKEWKYIRDWRSLFKILRQSGWEPEAMVLLPHNWDDRLDPIILARNALRILPNSAPGFHFECPQAVFLARKASIRS